MEDRFVKDPSAPRGKPGAKEWEWVNHSIGTGYYTPEACKPGWGKDLEINGWTWEALVAASPFHVEQVRWPLVNSGHCVAESRIPCTDGETIFVEGPQVDSLYQSAAYLFHEMAHCLLHYQKGPDPNLIDPLARRVSLWEAEACLAACQVMTALGFGDRGGYNSVFLETWRGDWGKLKLGRVAVVANSIIARYRREKPYKPNTRGEEK